MSIKLLHRSLRHDRWRETHPFSPDIEEANRLIRQPFVSSNAIVTGLVKWFAKKQPCVFGRSAAQKNGLFVSVITEDDINDGDEAVAAKISHDKRIWKQSAIVNPPNATPSSLTVLVASDRLAHAAPDENLRRFSLRILDLAGWSATDSGTEANAITSDYLYLRHPTEGTFFGFKYNVDYFAAAADKRWWHDHRVPGGIAFTANSPGHMRHFEEWYSHGADRSEWFVQTAMYTIAFAKRDAVEFPGALPPGEDIDPTADPEAVTMPEPRKGPVTWLRDAKDGQPLRAGCPYPFTGEIPPKLKGKDWSSYLGLLHTDHSVRKEFFDGMDSPEMLHQPYVMDFSYLYDRRESDHTEFMLGVPVTIERISEELGPVDAWGGPNMGMVPASGVGDFGPDEPRSVSELLNSFDRWTADQEPDDPNFYEL